MRASNTDLRLRANEPGAHLPHGASYVVKGGDRNPSDHRQRFGDVSAGENQKTERKEIWSLVPALPLNTQPSLR